MKITKKRYIQLFCLVVVVLAWTKEISSGSGTKQTDAIPETQAYPDCLDYQKTAVYPDTPDIPDIPETPEIPEAPHRIYSVSSFKNAFPDQNDVQLVAAEKHGIKPLSTRAAIEKNADKLVYVGSNPYFYVDHMKNSTPYLVPKAAALVQDIGRNFFDSLQVKGIPLHKIIVTSVLRTDEDVENLQRRNLNAAEKSCHQYATTVDICYNRYKTVQAPDGPARREVRNDSLKWVLSEVLNDMRRNDRCYVKYEVKQGCFHLTVR